MCDCHFSSPSFPLPSPPHKHSTLNSKPRACSHLNPKPLRSRIYTHYENTTQNPQRHHRAARSWQRLAQLHHQCHDSTQRPHFHCRHRQAHVPFPRGHSKTHPHARSHESHSARWHPSKRLLASCATQSRPAQPTHGHHASSGPEVQCYATQITLNEST